MTKSYRFFIFKENKETINSDKTVNKNGDIFFSN